MKDGNFPAEDNIAKSIKADQREKLAQDIASKWRRYTNDITELLSDSQEAWDFYLRNHPTTEPAQRENKINTDKTQRKGLRLGQIPKAVDSILSLIHNSMFPMDDRFFRGTAVNALAKELQEPTETFLAENFGQANISTNMRAFFHNALLDGTSCAYVPYEKCERKKTVYEQPTIDLGPLGKMPIPWKPVQSKTKTVVEWEGTKFIPLDFNDWRVDPAARCMDESPFLRRWYETTTRVEKDYPWVKDVSTYIGTESDQTNKRESAGLPSLIQSISQGEEMEGKSKALLMACYDDFVINGKSYPNHVAVVLNDCELVWFGPNPYNHGRIPYIVAPYNPIPGQIYGMSAVKHAIPSAAVTDKAVNLILQSSWWGAVPVMLKNMRDAAVRKHGNIEVRPGMTLPVETASAYTQLNVNLANLSILEGVMAKCEQAIQEVTGANPFIAGDSNAGSGDTTAFEVDQRVQGGNSRFQSIMTNLSNLVLEPYLQMAYSNFQQFKSDDEEIGEFIITPDDLKLMEWKWLTVASNATMSRNRKIANMKALLFEVMPGLVQQGVVKLKPVGMEFDQVSTLRSFLLENGILDADKILKVIELPPPVPTGVDGAASDLNGDVMNEYPSVPPTPNGGAINETGTNLPMAS